MVHAGGRDPLIGGQTCSAFVCSLCGSMFFTLRRQDKASTPGQWEVNCSKVGSDVSHVVDDARRALREQDVGLPVNQREEAEKILWAVPQSDRAAVGRLAQVAHDGLAEGKEDGVVNRRDRSIHVAPAWARRIESPRLGQNIPPRPFP